MEANKYNFKRKITMKQINKILKITAVAVVLSLFVGCKADELPCKSVPQGEFVLVE
jgi:hypothetical protein